MKKALLIAEKPSLMKDIRESYQRKGPPDQIDFTAFAGHTMSLALPGHYKPEWEKRSKENLPMIPSSFIYLPTKDKIKMYGDIKKLVLNGNYDYIINACDPAREGQHIFWSFYDSLNCKLPVKRLWFSDTTLDVLSESLNNLRDESEPKFANMTMASKLRARFDWLIGMNLSSAFSLASSTNISTGRVMSPTLNMVVKKTAEVKNFKSVPFWMISGDFSNYTGAYFDEVNKGRFLNKKDATDFISSLPKDGVVTSVESKKITSKAPALFDLPQLQSEASKLFGYSLKKTLQLAQSLYETHKILSYPRTDSQHVTEALAKEFNVLLDSVSAIPEFENLSKTILNDKNRLSSIVSDKTYVNNSKVTDHFAIVPTKKKPNVTLLSKDEANIYYLVVKRFLSIFLDPLVVEKSKIITTFDSKHDFTTNGSILVSKGFTELYGYNPTDQVLPNLKKGDSVKASKFNLVEKKTTPPKLYTDGTLGDAMRNASKFATDKDSKDILKAAEGIGQPATRSEIIEKLFVKDMIKREGKFIVSTAYGDSLIEAIGSYDVANVEMTAEWEGRLREVEAGTMSEAQFTSLMNTHVTKSCLTIMSTKIKVSGATQKGAATRKVIGNCPVCGSEVVQTKKYFVCVKHKNPCNFILPQTLWGGKIGVTDAKKIISGKETKLIQFETKSKWSAVLYYDKAEAGVKAKFNDQKNKSSNGEELFKTKDGISIFEDRYNYIDKSGNIRIPKNYWGVDIKKNEAKKMLDGGATPKKKLTWKDGSTSEKYLSYNRDTKKIILQD